MLPAAHNLAVVRETQGPQPLLERVVVGTSGRLDDHIDILRRPWRRSRGICDPEGDGRPTHEYDLIDQVAKDGCPELQEVDGHRDGATALRLSERRLSASERTRPSPIRMASISASRSARFRSRLAISGAFS